MSFNLTMASDLLPFLGPNERGQNRLSDASCLHRAVHSIRSADLERPVPVAGETVGRAELSIVGRRKTLSSLQAAPARDSRLTATHPTRTKFPSLDAPRAKLDLPIFQTSNLPFHVLPKPRCRNRCCETAPPSAPLNAHSPSLLGCDGP